MQSTKNGNRRTGWERITLGALLATGLLFTGTAQAQSAHRYVDQLRQLDRHDRHGRHAHVDSVRDARRIDRRLDRRGHAVNHGYDLLAFFAAVGGDYALAHSLDRHGDRAERYYDRKGDRLLRRARIAAHRHHASCGHARIDRHRGSRHDRHITPRRGHGHDRHLAPRRGHGHDRHRGYGRGHDRGHGRGHDRH